MLKLLKPRVAECIKQNILLMMKQNTHCCHTQTFTRKSRAQNLLTISKPSNKIGYMEMVQ